jgi:hypothetical protein
MAALVMDGISVGDLKERIEVAKLTMCGPDERLGEYSVDINQWCHSRPMNGEPDIGRAI